MNAHFTYNFINKTIVGTKTCIAKANKAIEPEYSELTAMLAEHPDFTVATKVIQQKADKKTYSKLTFERMKNYIKLIDGREEMLSQFEAVKEVAGARGATYPLTKKWFLTNYPDYKESELTEAEIA